MRLFVAMLVVTTLEVILIAKVGAAIGFFNTFLIIIATAMLGSWQLKKQFRLVFERSRAMQGEPSDALLEALILLIAGVLLITPGFLTDTIGFLCLFPTTRERLIVLMKRYGSRAITGRFYVYTNSRNILSNTSPSDESIIEGEFEHQRKDR